MSSIHANPSLLETKGTFRLLAPILVYMTMEMYRLAVGEKASRRVSPIDGQTDLGRSFCTPPA
jgi:hypothetical protein